MCQIRFAGVRAFMRASNCSCSCAILTSKLARAIIHPSHNLTTTTLLLPQSRPARRFASDPVTAKPAGEGIDRRPRIRRRVALPTAARRFPGRAVRLVNGRDCDVMAAVTAEDDAPGWLGRFDFRLQFAVFVHEKPRNKGVIRWINLLRACCVDVAQLVAC